MVSPQRNCYCYNEALQKHKSNDLFSWWHYSFFDIIAERIERDIVVPCIFIICLDYKLWMSVDLIENIEVSDILQKLWLLQTMQMILCFLQIHLPKPNLLHSLKQAAGGIGLNLNANKTEFMCFKQEGAISTLKFVDQFTYLDSNISSTESNVNIYIGKSWMAVNRLLIIWKSHISDKIRWEFFQAVVVSELLYGCTTWMLMKHIEKKLDGNYTRMLHAVLNKSWKQYLTKHQLYDHVPSISQAIQVRWTRCIEYYWRSKDKLTSEVLWWTLTYGCASVGCLARIYISSAWTLDAV